MGKPFLCHDIKVSLLLLYAFTQLVGPTAERSSSVLIFMALHTTEFYAYDQHSPLTVQALNFCTSFVSVESLVSWSMQVHKQNFPDYL